jgi:hypothetical protein
VFLRKRMTFPMGGCVHPLEANPQNLPIFVHSLLCFDLFVEYGKLGAALVKRTL